MKIVLLGSEGFIGKALFRRLIKTDLRVEPVITTSSPVFGGRSLDKGYEWLSYTLEGADVVYQCAGRTGGVGRMATDPLSFVHPNVRIHMNVFEACAAAGVKRVICLQSTTGYPYSAEPMHEHQYLEGGLHPAYFGPGTAHRFIYQLAQMFPKLEVLFFRPSNVYGPGNNFDPQTSHVIEASVRKVAERQDPFVIWGNGTDRRDAVYIDDLVEAMALGLAWSPGAYNVASGEEMSVNEIVAALFEHADFYPTIKFDASKPSAIPVRRVSIKKALALGWKPGVSMKEGLARTYDWYKSGKSGATL